MFKAIVLCELYNLSDDQVEYQLRDRLSFMRFLGLGLEDKVPDAKTVWLYREQLAHGQTSRCSQQRYQVVSAPASPNEGPSNPCVGGWYRQRTPAPSDPSNTGTAIHRDLVR